MEFSMCVLFPLPLVCVVIVTGWSCMPADWAYKREFCSKLVSVAMEMLASYARLVKVSTRWTVENINLIPSPVLPSPQLQLFIDTPVIAPINMSTPIFQSTPVFQSFAAMSYPETPGLSRGVSVNSTYSAPPSTPATFNSPFVQSEPLIAELGRTSLQSPLPLYELRELAVQEITKALQAEVQVQFESPSSGMAFVPTSSSNLKATLVGLGFSAMELETKEVPVAFVAPVIMKREREVPSLRLAPAFNIVLAFVNLFAAPIRWAASLLASILAVYQGAVALFRGATDSKPMCGQGSSEQFIACMSALCLACAFGLLLMGVLGAHCAVWMYCLFNN
ncbi:hypothetical protein EXIGLDRAFT_722948 [Exidia glandulosa HHB12029]|uniref:Uncharacterized protein n=1 Tax=Exidia glandulosa HHB12029 TaxID=1314781 RepID=A0A165F1K9_EXIGL|nr:hypothetical protein EXIGLDRAFT_722948 [Exidia glandulosa HHB12029]